MPLRDGDVAPDGDVWFRLITSESHLSRGKIKHGAFKGKFLGRASVGRPWATEISGRLRSVAGSIDDVRSHADAYCKARQNSGQKFVGLMFCHKAAVARVFDQFSTNVYFTPIASGPDADPAHSDIGITGPQIIEGSAEYDRLILELSDVLRGLHSPDQIDLLPSSEISRCNEAPQPAQTQIDADSAEPRSFRSRFRRWFGRR